MEEEGEELAAFAEDTAEDFGDGEDELAVGHFMTDGGGDPIAGGTDAPLMTGRTKVAAFASEGEQAFVPAVGAFEAREAGCEIATAEEGFDGGGGGRVERTEGRSVLLFVIREEVFPAVLDDLPEG